MLTARRWMKYPSHWSVVTQSLSLGMLIAAIVLVSAPAASFARATTDRFHFVEGPDSFTLTDYPCFEGVSVRMTSTLTRDGHFTESERHLSFHGTNTINYRVDVADGRHALGQVVDHFNFVFNLNRPRNVVSSTQQERATLYAANGQPIGAITVHVTHHLTYADLNGNFEPDPGEITVEVDRAKVTCR
jgi:hypothetical protein